MTRRARLGLVGAVLLGFMGGCVSAHATAQDDWVRCPDGCVAPAYQETITEDDPRWDCATMGNHICGTHRQDGAPAYQEVKR